MNYSRYSNDTHSIFPDLISISFRIYEAVPYVVIAIGILPNLWILVALLTSKVIRARMRNKLVCSLCFLHLMFALLITPIAILIWNSFEHFDEAGCTLRNIFRNIYLMQDFIANWTLVLMIAIFLAQICDFKPKVRVTGFTSILGTYAILASPWVASLVTIPVIKTSKSISYPFHPNFTIPRSCVRFFSDTLIIIRSLDTAIPLVIAVALMAAAVVLRRRRFTRGFSNGMQVELLDRGPAIDNHFGYTAAVVVMLVCDLPQALQIFELLDIDRFQRLLFGAVATLLSETKVCLSVLPWLLFPDIRKRIKTWRPWRCARPGADLTVVFKQ